MRRKPQVILMVLAAVSATALVIGGYGWWRICRLEKLTRAAGTQGVVARALGIPPPVRIHFYDWLMRIADHPDTVIDLHLHPDPAVQNAAAQLFSIPLHGLRESHLDRLQASAHQASPKAQRNLITWLANARPDGFERFLALLESPQAGLQESVGDVRYFGEGEVNEALARRLAAIATNSSLPLNNRLIALRVWSRLGDASVPGEQEIRTLAATEPEFFEKPARRALALLRMPESHHEREVYLSELADARRLLENTESPTAADYYLLAAMGSRAADFAPLVARHLKPLGEPMWDDAAMVLGRLGNPIAIPELIKVLHDPRDWHLAGKAAFALGELQATEALADLHKMASTYWHPRVRELAQEAIEAITSGQPPHLPQHQWWRVLHPPFLPQTKLNRLDMLRWGFGGFFEHTDWLRTPMVRARAPVITHVLYQDEVVDWELLPKHRHAFAGGTLYGYNEGEFGSGVVFYRKGETPKFFAVGGVTRMMRWGLRILIVEYYAMSSDGMLSVAEELSDGRVQVRPFFRPLFAPFYVQVQPDGSVMVDGYVRLYPDGTVEWIAETRSRNVE